MKINYMPYWATKGTKFPIRIRISDLKENLPYDPYDEIDPSLIASLITIILATILLAQISENKEIQIKYRDDALHLCRSFSKRYINCLEIAQIDLEHSNVIFELLLKRLK